MMVTTVSTNTQTEGPAFLDVKKTTVYTQTDAREDVTFMICEETQTTPEILPSVEVLAPSMICEETQTSPEILPSVKVLAPAPMFSTLGQDLQLSDSDSDDLPLFTPPHRIKRQRTALEELNAIDEPTIIDLLDYDEEGIDSDIM